MNWSQLKTVMWLRWRLTRNQASRSGGLNAAITVLATIVGVVFAIAAAVGGFFGGWLLLSKATPPVMMLVWDGMAGVFLFLWVIGVLAELQRSESIELGKLFHLPVSLGGIFLMNYIASHIAVSLILFVPAALGVCVGLVWAGKVWMALLIPLVLGFVFMITAWTYCLRGWLVSLMVNPRRRRNVIVGITLSMVLLGQLPNFYINVIARPGWNHSQTKWRQHARDVQPPRSGAEQLQAMIPRWFIEAHDYVPVLWLPRGAMALADGDAWPVLFGALGCGMLGAAGLARAYRSTLRFYLGQDTARAPKKIAAAKPAGAPVKNFLEKRLPFVSEDVAALTLAFFRSMSRAPEVKMALFSNLVVLIALVPIVMMNSSRVITDTIRLFTATSLVGVTFFGLLMQMFNHFGFDRDGFRALILSPASRRNVLLAKNLSLAPVALCMGVLLLSVLTILENLPLLMLVGALCKLVAMFLLLSVAGNLISIWVPYRVSAGSLKPTKPPAKTLLLIVLTQLLFPVVLIPNFIPPLLGIMFDKLWDWPAPLVDASLSFCLLVLGAGVYWLSLGGLGEMLERREQKILLVVSREVE